MMSTRSQRRGNTAADSQAMEDPSSRKRSRRGDVNEEDGEEEEKDDTDSRADGSDDDHIGPRAPQRKSRKVEKDNFEEVPGPASHNWESSRDKLVENAKVLPGWIMNHMVDIPTRLAAIDEGGRQYIEQNHPPMTMEMLEAMLPDAAQEIDSVWTQQEEQAFAVRFGADPYRNFMTTPAAHPHKNNTDFLPMWKTITQLRGCFPTDIVGARRHLQFSGTVDLGGGIALPDPRWPKAFCKSLSDLAVASPCGANMNLLALLIRWAVAVRIDDRRQVPLNDHKTDGRFLDELADAVQRHNRQSPLRTIHRDLRAGYQARGTMIPWVSDVMRILEENSPAPPPTPTTSGPGEEFPVYEVATADLTRLIKAFDDIADLGFRSLETIEWRAAIITYHRSRKDAAPSSFGDLNRLRLPLLMAEERFKAKRLLASRLEMCALAAALVASQIMSRRASAPSHQAALSELEDMYVPLEDDDPFRDEHMPGDSWEGSSGEGSPGQDAGGSTSQPEHGADQTVADQPSTEQPRTGVIRSVPLPSRLRRLSPQPVEHVLKLVGGQEFDDSPRDMTASNYALGIPQAALYATRDPASVVGKNGLQAGLSAVGAYALYELAQKRA
ncbi:hypothetical protein F5B20DRAFT_591336 [Whalleya microplaca]|nr:hypothetical protein F5B20DRAFT_591336 [Whalleya microplaca]